MLSNVILDEVGIREGEKLHEVMITKDDSRTTYEYENHYIIYPHYDWWNSKKYLIPGGKLIDEGFEYSSGTNKDWLNVNQIRKMLVQLNMMPVVGDYIKEIAVSK